MPINGQKDQDCQEVFKLSYDRYPLLGFGVNGSDDGKPHLIANYLAEEDHSFKEHSDGKPQDDTDKKFPKGSQGYGQRAIRNRCRGWDKRKEEDGQNKGKAYLCPLGDSRVAKERGRKYQPCYPEEEEAKGQDGMEI